MRVTTETKQRTRYRILDAARELFTINGFDETTTRDIAAASRIATGTLFNYFPSKESLAMAIANDALHGVDEDFEAKVRGTESVDELLFLFIVLGLRRLKPYRGFIGPAFEATMSPFGDASKPDGDEPSFRRDHLECVQRLLAAAGLLRAQSFVSLHLYWTLYLGVVAFWSRDESPNQEDTLVLLDQSVRLFVASLGSGISNAGADQTEAHHGA